MPTRRQILQWLMHLFLWIGAVIGLGFAGVAKLWAGAQKRILPKNTVMQSLRNQNPEFLDTRNLDIMPLEAFEIMGDKDAPYTADTWRLEVSGAVRSTLVLTYAEIRALPPVSREVLLVCPGVFVNHGRWQGVDLQELMQRAGASADVSKVHFYGYSRLGEKKETFGIDDVRSGRVFLAYDVNGQPLPRKHGFPLRVVAEGHWGMYWLKYVTKLEFL